MKYNLIQKGKGPGFVVRVAVPREYRDVAGAAQIERGLRTRDKGQADERALEVCCGLLKEWRRKQHDLEHGIAANGPDMEGLDLGEKLNALSEWAATYKPSTEVHLKVLQRALRGVTDLDLRSNLIDELVEPLRASDEQSGLPSTFTPEVEQAATQALHGTLLDAAYEYVDRPVMQQVAHGTRRIALTWLKELNDFLGQPTVSSVTVQDVDRYVEHCSTSGVSKGSTANRVSRFRRAWKYWVRSGLASSNPWSDVDLKEYAWGETEDRQGVSPEQFKAMIDAAAAYPDTATFMALGIGTGLRRGELMGIRSEHVEAVTIAGQQRYLLDVQGTKTKNAVRRVPVPLEMTHVVTELLDRKTTYLMHNGDTETQARAMGRKLANVLKAAKVASPDLSWEGVTPAHSFRRSYIQILMQTGVDTLAAKVLLGHTTADITFGLYGRNAVSTEGLFEAVDAASWGQWLQEG